MNTQERINSTKTSKLIVIALVAVALTGVVVTVNGCKDKASSQSSGQALKYTCGMHPDVVQDKPGNCPKCGMALVEKR